MREDDPNSPGNYTYSDAMNDWASQQDSFVRRSRGRIFHPDGNSSGFGRFFGYLWRLVLFVLLAALVTVFFVRRHVRTQEFADSIAALIARELGAESAEIAEFRWKGSTANSPAFSATGSGATFFRAAEGRYLSFERPLWRLFSTEWKLGPIAIGELSIELQAGGLGAVPDLPEGGPGLPVFPTDAAPETDINIDRLRLKGPDDQEMPEPDRYNLDLDIKSGGLAISLAPRPDRVAFSGVQIALLKARWGLNDFTRGSLAGSDCLVQPNGSGDGWTITANSGTLQQNWLHDLRIISPLVIQYVGDTLTFEPCQLEIAQSGGTGTLSGTVTTGDTPKVDLTLSLEGVPLAALLERAPDFSHRVTGNLHGELSIGGSTNTAEGLTIDLDARLTSGTLRGIALLDVLALPTSHDAFRSLPVSGTFSLKSSEGTTAVSDIDLASGDKIHIAGEFAFSPQDTTGVENPPDLPDELSGHLRVGLAPGMLDGFPEVREKFFVDDPAGVQWLETPLSGLGPRYTEAAATAVLEAYRADKDTAERNRAHR